MAVGEATQKMDHSSEGTTNVHICLARDDKFPTHTLTQGKEFHEHILFDPIVDADQMITQNGHVCWRPPKGDESQMPKHTDRIHDPFGERFHDQLFYFSFHGGRLATASFGGHKGVGFGGSHCMDESITSASRISSGRANGIYEKVDLIQSLTHKKLRDAEIHDHNELSRGWKWRSWNLTQHHTTCLKIANLGSVIVVWVETWGLPGGCCLPRRR